MEDHGETDPGEESPARDRESLATTRRQFWVITRAFFTSKSAGKAFGFLIGLLLLALAAGLVQMAISYSTRDFMTAVGKRDPNAYMPTLWKFVASLVLGIPVVSYYRWVEERMALFWRTWMAQHLVKRYFNNRAYFRLRNSDSVDNPDQRISEDVRNFTTSSLAFLLIALNSLITLITFLWILWSISTLLVTILVAYATIGTAVSIAIGRKLVRLHYHQYEKEADFRYGLVRIRDNAESIAFYRGERREHIDLIGRLSSAVSNMKLVINRNLKLNFFTNGYNYLALVLPFLVVAPMYMRGEIELGDVVQSGGAFAAVLGSVSLVITQFNSLSTYLAGVQRLGSLWDQLDEDDVEEKRIAYETANQTDEHSKIVKLDKLTICTPGKMKILVDELSFELQSKQSLIIMGPSGSGKSSVLRTIAGLWPGASGLLERPAANQLMFLPQRPYMVEGSLRDQLLYPYPDRKANDEELRKIMDEVNLSDVLERVDGDLNRKVDWGNMLSLGEQQRIALARLFLRNPRFAFLDEATSALDEENQARLYQRLHQSNTGYISVGHRTTLIQYHDRVLTLDHSGSWEIQNAEDIESQDHSTGPKPEK